MGKVILTYLLSIYDSIISEEGLRIIKHVLLDISVYLCIVAVTAQIIKEYLNMSCKFKKPFYNAKNFEGKSICNRRFPSNTVFEKDSELFQKLKDKSLYNVSLPSGDYSMYNFSDIKFERTFFYKGSILPNDSELFQKIKNKSLEGTVLPEGDFRKYNFNDVDIYFTQFSKNSRLSYENDVFQNVRDKVLDGVALPCYEARYFHLYKLNGVCIDCLFLEKNKLNKYQTLIAYNKGIGDKNILFV